MGISIHPLNPTIGAVIEGVRLDEPLDDVTAKEMEQAFLDHSVIFLRNQNMTPEAHLRFASVFGTPEPHPFNPNLGGDLEAVHLLTSHGPEDQYAANWHTDVIFEETPPLGSTITLLELPPLGGDTMWASMYAAYDALSDRMKTYLEGLTAIWPTPPIPQYQGAPSPLYDPNYSSEAEHPLVRTHPVTKRKALYFNTQPETAVIKQLSAGETKMLMTFLREHRAAPAYQVRWTWRLGDVALWDNRCAVHYGVPDYNARRVLQRITLKGDRPV